MDILSEIFSWRTLWWLMMVLYVPSCLGLIIIVLLQKGKGSGFAGAFGMGGGETVFGPRASQSLPVRMTHVMAAIFMIMALVMSMIAGKVGRGVAPDAVIAGDVQPSVSSQTLDELGIGEFANDPEAEEAATTPAATAGEESDVETDAPAEEAAEEAPAEESAEAAPEEPTQE